MDIICEENAIIQPLDHQWYHGKVATIDMLRLDLVHPVISGNKWYKLKRNLEAARECGANQIITFGGAYSNHLVAAAAAAQAAGIKAVGVVRGLYAKDMLTVTLQNCIDAGMQLVFVSTADYSRKDDPEFLAKLQDQYGEGYIIPEGGANNAGRLGAGDIARLIPADYTHVCLSVGTGTSMIGIRNVLSMNIKVLGFAPFKNGTYLKDEMARYLDAPVYDNWEVLGDWHFGGFGKWDNTLLEFMNEFYDQNQVPLDIIYNGKMMYGIKQLLDKDFFDTDARILCIHTGGLQGNSAVQKHLVY